MRQIKVLVKTEIGKGYKETVYTCGNDQAEDVYTKIGEQLIAALNAGRIKDYQVEMK